MQQVGAGAINGKTPLNKMSPNGYPDWRGDQHGNGNGNVMEPNLSVVTTVWGMSSSTQSGPYSSYSGGPNSGMQGGDGLNNNSTNTSSSGCGGGYMKGPQFWANPNQYSGGTTFTQNRSEGQNNVGGGSQEYSNSNPLGMAMVTAIATASATATVVALQERQDGSQYAMNSMPTHQYNMMHYNNSGNNQPGGPPNAANQSQKMGPGGPGPMNPGMNTMKMPTHPQGDGGSYSSRNRSSPYSYPNPPNSHINQKRGHMNQSMGPNPHPNYAAPPGVVPQQTFDGSSIYSVPEPPSQSNYTNPANPRMMFRGTGRGAASGARQIPNPNNPYMPPNAGQYYNPNGPRGGGPTVHNMPHPHNGPPPNYSHATYMQQQQQQHSSIQSMHYQNGLSPATAFPPENPGPLPPYSSVGEPKSLRTFQQSPIPGNPTPPLTPGSGGCCNLNSLGESKPVIHSAKHDGELRLTFPVRDGTILAPFRLEHNLAVSNHVFHLKPTVHQTLTWRSDLELQLKCFHHEDRQMNTNWPASVQVSVNAIPLSIDRGDNKVAHRPLYLKDICLPGRNTLQITVSACCCSHLFVLQLVHRPSVRSVLQGLLRKRLLPSEHCVTKIKRHFNNSYGSQGVHDGDGVEQTAIKVSLKCPITYKRMALPARGHDCRHVQCFDLESYLQMNCERAAWRCPVCNKSAQLEGLEVDQYIWSILNSLEKSDSDEVTIDSAANWREAKSGASVNKTKSEELESCSAKKTKLIRPQEMPTPVWNSDAVLSPYNPPTMNSISMGSGVNFNGWNDVQNPYEFGGEHGDPLNRLKESVNSIDALNAMERSIRETGTIPVSQMKQETSKGDIPYILHTPQTPHTPGTSEVPPNPSSPLIVPNTNKSHHQDCDTALLSSDLPSDLNFDPESVINGDGSGPDELNLLPNSGVDPLELLSYLEPSGLATPPSSGNENGNNSNVNSTPDSLSDDLLALFD